MVANQLLDVNEVGGDLSHRCRQILTHKALRLLCKIGDVLLSETAVDYIIFLVHRYHVVVQVLRVCTKLRNISLESDREVLLISGRLFLASIGGLLLIICRHQLLRPTLSTAQRAYSDKGDWPTSPDRFFRKIDCFGDQF